ncbi:MAG TPA: SDR family oxidoreductase [Gemmatimonadaceae bacterium]|nr:SDR family oxidoreductase [Gemmatimonadaceae bacterium]
MTETIAIVTGHSRGLGAAIAAELLARGTRVLGLARHENSELAQRHGSALTQLTLDLADLPALTRWLESDALAQFLRDSDLALLVNNAGLLEPLAPLQKQGPADVARAIAVNVGAALVLSAAFVAATNDVADRRILHISSGAGRKAYAGWSVYCASKAALDNHARAVALDHTERLRISAVAPGVIDTNMQDVIRASSVEDVPNQPRFVDLWREGKLQKTDDVARALVDFVLSDGFGAEPVSDLRQVTT